MTTHVEIKNGPAKFDLMLALFDNKDWMRNVTFVGNGGAKYVASIFAVEAQYNSESWEIKGRVRKVDSTEGVKITTRDPGFTSIFNTKDRTGFLVID